MEAFIRSSTKINQPTLHWVADGRNMTDSIIGTVIWSAEGGVPSDYQYYNVPAKKTDFNIYGKWQQQMGNWFTSFVDLQWRQVNYWINGFDNNPSIILFNRYNFINPKAGITYIKGPMQAYFSFARATHEPNRDDFETGLTEQPVPETVNDFELGLNKKTPAFQLGYYRLLHAVQERTGTHR